jgi:hypothetical protein
MPIQSNPILFFCSSCAFSSFFDFSRIYFDFFVFCYRLIYFILFGLYFP